MNERNCWRLTYCMIAYDETVLKNRNFTSNKHDERTAERKILIIDLLENEKATEYVWERKLIDTKKNGDGSQKKRTTERLSTEENQEHLCPIKVD